MTPLPETLAVDFGGTSIKIAVTQGDRILKKARPLPTASYNSPEEIMAAMCLTMKELLREHPHAAAVGLGMPGWVDFYRGVLYQLTNVPVWDHEVPVREVISQELGLPVVLDNDANCMAYAEWKLGAGRGLENLVCLTLGTGLGGGIVIHNRLLRGRTVSCAELGQTSIAFNGRIGPFGNRGAIEEYLGNNEFAADAVQAYANAGINKTAEECAPHLLEQAARAGDAIAKQLYRDFADKLSILIMNLMYALVPEAIIIGGGVAKAGDLLFSPLQESLKAQLFPVHYNALQIHAARFGADAGLIGAGLMAADAANRTLL
ncbi:MAG: ROK family protein [Akkermansia sp.]|nr:ROK family protein [Akkermansia sp.]